MDKQDHLPFQALEPQIILEAIEHCGFICDGSLLALNSYENRVYQVGIDNAEPLIAKFYRPQRWSSEAIQEEHQFAQELVEHELPVIAPLRIKGQSLHHYNEFRFALFPRRGGHGLELDNNEQLAWMGRFLGRLHRVSAAAAFKHRIQLNTQNYGHEPYAFLLKNDFIPDYLKANFCRAAEGALAKIEELMSRLGTIDSIRLHGDCHAGNVLWRDSAPHIVDLDDCLMGPAIQDLWMLLSGDAQQMEKQLETIVQAYTEFHDFNFRERHLIEILRTLRLLHYSGWLAKRWTDPAFPLSFPWFNTPGYWQNLLNNLNEQLELLEAVDI